MSVRRLAEETVQPKDFAFNRANSALAKQWIKKYPDGRQASAVIPLLMIAQEQEGWVTKRAIEHIADMLAMPYIRVLEVATFYTQFMLAPVGTRAHVQVCGTTPCMLRGSEELMAVCREKIHPEQFHTNEGGTLSWEEVECQGACVNAPMVMIFKDTYEDLTPERLAEIIDEFEAGRGDRVTPGPQVNRIHSAPEGGQTTLQKELLVKGAAKPVSKPAKAKPAAKAKAVSAKPVAKPGPVRLAKPEGKADDLKMIAGVGPKLEKTLNKLGFWHFAQIAKWTKKDIAIVDDELSFKGRIERDDWVKQAKALAKGGRDEYVRVFGKEPR
ncbi:MAG: NADH-quinone oxidoreductase subunit NuoE [Phyllobacteriaceae bacterium]|nr:NADH-quinone oxidoreductase subunit NuoE [Phyllobacteriaceae bacterium]